MRPIEAGYETLIADPNDMWGNGSTLEGGKSSSQLRLSSHPSRASALLSNKQWSMLNNKQMNDAVHCAQPEAQVCIANMTQCAELIYT